MFDGMEDAPEIMLHLKGSWPTVKKPLMVQDLFVEWVVRIVISFFKLAYKGGV